MEDLEYLKEQGNKEFLEGNFFQALSHYSQAILLQPTPALHCNRAACLLKMKKYDDAIEDCDQALVLDKGQIKAYYRKSQALSKQGKLLEASKVIKEGLEQVQNKEDLQFRQ